MKMTSRKIAASGAAIAAAAALLVLLVMGGEGEDDREPPAAEAARAVEDSLDVIEPETPEVPEAAEVEPPSLVLDRVEGRVELRRGGAGEWAAAEAGAILDPTDVVRTRPGARATLEAGDHIVHLLPATDLRLEELTADISRFLLGAGMVSADAGGEGRSLRIDADGGQVSARADSGRFTVSGTPGGLVAVGSEDARVSVSGRGREVVLRAGEGTLVRPGGTPSEPEPLPDALLLRVAWPEETETNRSSLTVAGRTSAGALVLVAGQPVEVDRRGRFETEIPLREGRNRVRVEGFDVAGNTARRSSPPIVVDRRGSKASFDTEDLWGE